MSRSSPHPRSEHLWILAAATVALVGAFLLQPATGGRLCLPVPALDKGIPLPGMCVSRTILGVSCPGCGLTRSFVALAHGDLGHAIEWNPMGPVLFVICLFQVPYRIVEYVGLWKERIAWMRVKKLLGAVTWLAPAGLIGCWLLRMIPGNLSVW